MADAVTVEERALIDAAVRAGRVSVAEKPVARLPGAPMRDAAVLQTRSECRPLPRWETQWPKAPNGKRLVPIRALLEWAFQIELASIDFDEVGTETGARPGIGMEWIMMQRAQLGGVRIDGGGRSDPHPDADVVASAVAALPVAYGGRSMAVHIAELARAGMVPDFVADPQPRCEPVGWKQSKHGRFAEREYWMEAGRWPKSMLGCDHGYACRVTYSDTPRQTASQRRAYLQWWGALRELRDNLRIWSGLSAFEVTGAMPPLRPWQKNS